MITDKIFSRFNVRVFSSIVVLIMCAVLTATVSSAQVTGFEKAPPSVIEAIASGQPQEVIVLFDDTAIQNAAASMRESIGIPYDNQDITNFKAEMYSVLKQNVISTLPEGGVDILTDYSNLPMMFMRVNSLSSMQQLTDRPEVVRVYENEKKYHMLTSTLPFINQPQVAALGMVGTGTTVAVLDTGVNYLNSAFGTCTGAGTPADCCPGGDCNAAPPAAPTGCKVACVHDFAPNDGQLDADGHGTNVSGIVVGVAPDTKVIGLDVFTGGGAWDTDIISAINWSINKKTAYNIVAMNLSLGRGWSTTPCGADTFAAPISNARQAGILAAIASGNNAYIDRISSPACVPAAVSVGAVYDSNIGGVSYSSCTDSTTAPDKVTCFSNSAYFLTILAPGAQVTAAGYTMYGTSQATPHIAGSIAVIKGVNAFPGDTPDQVVTRMTSTGVLDTDTKSGVTTPRIDLLAAVGGGVTTYSISGTVTTPGVGSQGGSPLSGVTMNLTGTATGTTTTNASGNYTFTGLANGSYTVTPSMTGYTFSPTSRTVPISGANVTGQNFTGTYTGVTTYSISGTVTSGGNPLAGVTMTLSGAATGTTTTNASGNYTFTGLANGSYTVTPSKAGYTFSPTSRAITISGANVTGQDFTGTPTGGTFSISGRVTEALGSSLIPLSGVTMTLSGAATGTTITNASGNYTFTGLANGSYTVTPSKAGYTFSPTSRAITISGANVTGQNFTGTYTGVTTYSISGTVTSGGNPLAGVTMTLTGAGTGTTTTNASGNYTFSGLANGSYIVTPSMTGYTFNPTNRAVTVNNANVTGQDFIGTPTGGGSFSISGRVVEALGSSFIPLPGVTMTLSGAGTGTTVTDGNGNYTFTGLANGSYTVTPSITGYTFSPTSRAITISGANVTGQNFTGNQL